ncbi:MAG: glutamine amidotransferase [Leptolyngbyaceae cyanobacterium]
MAKILVVVHQDTSNPGLVGQKLVARGYQLDIRCPALGDPLPTTLADHAATVIFGGPMSANDDSTLPFIHQELQWIPTALAANKPYLGICLGAQLLARVLGAAVAPHPEGFKEIGYYPITPTRQGCDRFPQPMSVYQWHGEGFELPKGAVALATGNNFEHQAYCYGDAAYGLQFHPEITTPLIDEWTTRGADQLTGLGVYSRDQQFKQHQQLGAEVNGWLDRFLDQWLTASWAERMSA